MIEEIRKRIQNKAQYIENVKRMKEPSLAAISVKNVCVEEVAFLQEVLKKMKELQGERDLARYEVVVYGDVIRTKNDKIERLEEKLEEDEDDD